MSNAAELRGPILRACFGEYEGTFASGVEANNKLDLERLPQRPALAARIAVEVGGLVSRYNPDLLVPVPNGANWLVDMISAARGIDRIVARKDPETKAVTIRNGDEICSQAHRLVVVEDVLNGGTNSGRVIEALDCPEKVVAVVGIWNRGDIVAQQQRFSEIAGHEVAVVAAVEEYIPPMLPTDSPLWDFAS